MDEADFSDALAHPLLLVAVENALLSREAFRLWLRGRPAGSCVGSLGDDGDCPLARFLAQSHGRSVVVSSSHWWFADEPRSESKPLSPWALSFVAALDESSKATVSRERALSTLEGLAR